MSILACHAMTPILIIVVYLSYVNSSVVHLSSGNINDVLQQNEIVLINFFAEWCHFSRQLSPLYDAAADRIQQDYSVGKVALGKVNCEQEGDVCAQHKVNKYPTVKLFRFGQPTKREYRGQRSTDSIVEFIGQQLQDPIHKVEAMDDLDNVDLAKRNVIGYFDSSDSPDFSVYSKVASFLRDDCTFHAAFGQMTERERIAGNKVVYRKQTEDYSDLTYSGPLTDYNLLLRWTTDKCIPLVREITFQNAEELAEEGLPFMILFHHPDDRETPETYSKQIAMELYSERYSINFLTADGLKFTHPLQHLGKSANDLPVLAIDSFRHMYLWNHNPSTDLTKSGLLKQFVADLHSEKLHREFHHGPDPTIIADTTLPVVSSDASSPDHRTDDSTDSAAAASGPVPDIDVKVPEVDEKAAPVEVEIEDTKTGDVLKHVTNQADEDTTSRPVKVTSPGLPESMFRKLGPSRTRYTILRDEL